MKKIKVKWEVEDGYAGKSRPQYSEIPEEELEGLEGEERMDAIYQWVQNDFEQTISFAIIDIKEAE